MSTTEGAEVTPFHVTVTVFVVAPELAIVTVALPLPVAVGVRDSVTVCPDDACAGVMVEGETVN